MARWTLSSSSTAISVGQSRQPQMVVGGTSSCSWMIAVAMWLQLLTSKDEAVEAIKKFKARVETESDKKLHMLWTDRGGEFTSVEFTAYCTDQGVVRHHTAPYSP